MSVDGGLEATAERLAALLTGTGESMSDPSGSDLVLDGAAVPVPLSRLGAPVEIRAVDGGQALVADAKTLQVYATRAATVTWRHGSTVEEDQGELLVHLVGCGEQRQSLAALDSPVAPDAPVDVNLLRDWGEWRAVAAAVATAPPGAMVLVDGDLQPDWRIPSHWLAGLLDTAAERSVTLVGVTKHSSLARGGAPLVGLLEQEAAGALGERATWWAPIGATRPDVGAGIDVVAARLDPDAPYAFRVDLPSGADPEATLGALSAVCDDAAFPGYPYPLSLADRLAACSTWVKQDLWDRLSAHFGRLGVTPEVARRAFDDRHRLMERA